MENAMTDQKADDKAVGITPPETDKIKDVTVQGYTFKFDAEKLDDVEVIEMAAKIEEGQTTKIIEFVKFLLGDHGYNDMKNFYITQDGKFKITTLVKVFESIFEKFDPKG